ncbi:hypothetical protein F4814DRAFT_452418 [Daldinia grandis]|nr:hypothetical protein F4814DRAFT_452418 [Daldinia grandis]
MADSGPNLQEAIDQRKIITRINSSPKEEYDLSLAEDLEKSRKLLQKLEEEGKRTQEQISELGNLLAQLRCTFDLVRLERMTWYEAFWGKKEDGGLFINLLALVTTTSLRLEKSYKMGGGCERVSGL